jgi:cysteine desulfurase
MEIYLDNNATTQPLDEVVDAVHRAARDLWANPSSMHRPGQRARQAVEQARGDIAALLGCRGRDILFTSGATESNNLALRGISALRKGRRVILTTEIEHSAIREPLQAMTREGFKVIHAPVDRQGVVDTDRFEQLLDDHADHVAMATIHWVNNETGTIQPLARLAAMCHDRGVPLHTDATQAVGRMPIDVKKIGVDALSCSGHKFHGPKGTGVLYTRSTLRIAPQIIGGPHERQRRGGTENVPGIVGMGVAAKLAGQWLQADGPATVQAMRDRFERTIIDAVPDTAINCAEGPRIGNTTSIAFAQLEAEAIMLLLSERGVCASAGAACSSGSLEPSPVLLAIGIPETLAHGSIRFSFSRLNSDDEIDRAIEVIPGVIERLRSSMAPTITNAPAADPSTTSSQ